MNNKTNHICIPVSHTELGNNFIGEKCSCGKERHRTDGEYSEWEMRESVNNKKWFSCCEGTRCICGTGDTKFAGELTDFEIKINSSLDKKPPVYCLGTCERCGIKINNSNQGKVEYGVFYPEIKFKTIDVKDGKIVTKKIDAHREIKKIFCMECSKELYDKGLLDNI